MSSFRRIALGIIAIQILVILGITSFYRVQQPLLGFSFFNESEASTQSSTLIQESVETDGIINVSPSSPLLLPEIYTLVDDDRDHFTTLPDGTKCFTAGTLLDNPNGDVEGNSTCKCLQDYYGKDCGIPKPVWLSACDTKAIDCSKLKARAKPRRLIHGVNVNHEVEFFEMRLEEVGEVVDILIVGESNMTAGGEPSPMYLLPKLQEGFMSHWQHKILHVFIDRFPPQGFADGWLIDTYLRDFMGEKGLARINGIREDDLFLLLDADEIPNREVLLFLKLYDGYPEPISLTMRWSVYGFFWKRAAYASDVEDVTRVYALSTIGMIRQVYECKVMSLRRHNFHRDQALKSRAIQYGSSGDHPFAEWNIGQVGAYAGFHCSWCYRPEGIRLKLTAAQMDDKPRWGDYKEKLDLDYIAGLIRTGYWFDGSKPFFLVKPKAEGDPLYAPSFVWKNKERFDYILIPPSSKP